MSGSESGQAGWERTATSGDSAGEGLGMEQALGLAIPGGTCTAMCRDAPKLLGREQRSQHGGLHAEEGRRHSLSEQLPLAKATPGQQRPTARAEGTEQDITHQLSEQSSSVPSPTDDQGKSCHPTCRAASLQHCPTDQEVVAEELGQLHADDVFVQREQVEGPFITGDI